MSRTERPRACWWRRSEIRRSRSCPRRSYPIAVEAEVLKVVKLSDTRVTVVVRGLERRRHRHLRAPLAVSLGRSVPVLDGGDSPEAEGLALAVRETAKKVIALAPDIPDETAQLLDNIRDPSRLADLVVRQSRPVGRRADGVSRRAGRADAPEERAIGASASGPGLRGQRKDRHAGARGVLTSPARSGPAPEDESDPGGAGRVRRRRGPLRVRREDQARRHA